MSIGGTYLPSGNNNINGQIFATLFVNTGSFDALYQLASGSPAANAGLNGDDMGGCMAVRRPTCPPGYRVFPG